MLLVRGTVILLLYCGFSYDGLKEQVKCGVRGRSGSSWRTGATCLGVRGKCFMLGLQFKACFGKEPSVSNCWWHNFLPVSSCDYFLRSQLSLKYASWAATFRLFPIRHYVYLSFSAVPLNESWFKSIILSGGEILFLVSAWKVRGYSIKILIKSYRS